jgi:hypothetical protein
MNELRKSGDITLEGLQESYMIARGNVVEGPPDEEADHAKRVLIEHGCLNRDSHAIFVEGRPTLDVEFKKAALVEIRHPESNSLMTYATVYPSLNNGSPKRLTSIAFDYPAWDPKEWISESGENVFLKGVWSSWENNYSYGNVVDFISKGKELSVQGQQTSSNHNAMAQPAAISSSSVNGNIKVIDLTSSSNPNKSNSAHRAAISAESSEDMTPQQRADLISRSLGKEICAMKNKVRFVQEIKLHRSSAVTCNNSKNRS